MSPTEQWYQQAVQKWPNVKWPLSAYDSHLRGESPRCAVDLFLAGAAGYRQPSAWETIEKDLGPSAQRVLNRQPRADASGEELWSETIARLLENDPDEEPLADGHLPARIIRYRGMVPLMNYLILIGKRMAIQKHRRAKPTMSLTDAGDTFDEPVKPGATAPDAAMEERDVTSSMCEAMGTAFAALSSDQKFLIVMVYQRGMRQKEAGLLLGWNESKTSRALSSAMEKLRKAIKGLADVQWTPTLSAAWSDYVQKCWKNVQVPQQPASV